MKYIGLNPISSNPQIELFNEDRCWDLHNAAEFIGYEHDQQSKNIMLFWNYYYDYNNAKFKKIALEFQDVSEFNLTEKDPEVPRDEDECLEKIYAIDSDTICLSFRGGQAFTISCGKLIFHENLIDEKTV